MHPPVLARDMHLCIRGLLRQHMELLAITGMIKKLINWFIVLPMILYETVGTISDAGKMSPHRMTVTTITDQLRLHTQMKGKVIAVALKDRGAVLPGGHTANAAYWFLGGGEGKWISSTYYMENLPKWVVDFNSSNVVEKYKKPWNTIEDINFL